MEIADWWRLGSRIRLSVAGQEREVFCRVDGDGPWVTLLHGFPTCSFDWAPLWQSLARRFRILAFDYLGYGDSDKPDIEYSTALHADTVVSLWHHFGIESSYVVGHDVGTAVAQELLARRASQLKAVLLTNGAVITD